MTEPPRLFLSAALAAALVAAGCHAKPEPPPVPSAFHGRHAIRAALLAAPKPPQTLDEDAAATDYLGGHLFQLFDSNKDGALEFDEWLESTFATYLISNASHDGRLKYDEFLAYYEPPGGERLAASSEKELRHLFDSMDHGKKGYLTVDDFRDLAASWFAVNDLDKDGKITEDEIKRAASHPAHAPPPALR